MDSRQVAKRRELAANGAQDAIVRGVDDDVRLLEALRGIGFMDDLE